MLRSGSQTVEVLW